MKKILISMLFTAIILITTNNVYATENVTSDDLKVSLENIINEDIIIEKDFTTREEFCEILFDISEKYELKQSNIDIFFIDNDEIQNIEPVNWAVKNGLFIGNEKSEFMPSKYLTYYEMNIVLDRFKLLLNTDVNYNLTSKYKLGVDFILGNVPNPTFSVTGGEWAVIALSDNGNEEFEKVYYNNLVKYLKDNDGVLSTRKYTEYSRVSLALIDMKKDPTNIEGFDLVNPLLDFETTTLQGINGAIYALMVIETIYPNEFEDLKERYIEEILSYKLENGAFSLDKKTPYVDITAMAIQVLSMFNDDEIIETILEDAIMFLSNEQSENGAFEYDGVYSGATVAQVIIALNKVGITIDNEKFVKNGNSLITAIEMFENEDGGYKNVLKDTNSDLMTTEQIIIAIKNSIN